jgi:hypothetical protein
LVQKCKDLQEKAVALQEKLTSETMTDFEEKMNIGNEFKKLQIELKDTYATYQNKSAPYNIIAAAVNEKKHKIHE